MAQVVSVKEVCDVCHNTRRQVKPYRVGSETVLVRALLCKEDGAMIDQLMLTGRHVSAPGPKIKVWTMDEISKRKKGTQRTPPSP